MPMTPSDALGQCPAAHLDDEERLILASALDRIDAMIREKWDGAGIVITTEALRPKIISRVIRAYVQKSWAVVGAKPKDGNLVTAQQLLAAGAPVEWEIALSPDWRPAN